MARCETCDGNVFNRMDHAGLDCANWPETSAAIGEVDYKGFVIERVHGDKIARYYLWKEGEFVAIYPWWTDAFEQIDLLRAS